jgi:apolipoprotein N-acyltransferase
VFRPAVTVADVPLRDPRTVADRLGVWPEHGLAAAGLLWLLAVAVEGRRRSRPPAEPVVDEPLLAGAS